MLFELLDFQLCRRAHKLSVVDFERTENFALRAQILVVLKHFSGLQNLAADGAVEEQVFIVLLDVAAYVLRRVGFPATRAGLCALGPLQAAILAENSLALLALLGVLDNVVTNRALEHVFELEL